MGLPPLQPQLLHLLAQDPLLPLQPLLPLLVVHLVLLLPRPPQLLLQVVEVAQDTTQDQEVDLRLPLPLQLLHLEVGQEVGQQVPLPLLLPHLHQVDTIEGQFMFQDLHMSFHIREDLPVAAEVVAAEAVVAVEEAVEEEAVEVVVPAES